ncbi:unnamed protein product [Allacma fusca]|uniref:Uncharacterized protein n=1 Tax=Allacma fusca TaxID=39272 RepID=A0A8J2NTB3_9HEXA|nr:unnamed protein product [Allacma fusca]
MLSIAVLTLLVLIASTASKVPTLGRIGVIQHDGVQEACTYATQCEGSEASQAEFVGLTMTGCDHPVLALVQGQSFNYTLFFKPSVDSTSYVTNLYEVVPGQNPILLYSQTFSQSCTVGNLCTLPGSGVPNNGVAGNCTYQVVVKSGATTNGGNEVCGKQQGNFTVPMTP